jgi:hypothetical protein
MLIPIAAFLAFAVVVIAWGVITGEIGGPPESKKLLDLRHGLWTGAPDEAGVDLLDRTRVVLVQMNEREQRLDHRLEARTGGKSGRRSNSHGRGLYRRTGRVLASRRFASRSLTTEAQSGSKLCGLRG